MNVAATAKQRQTSKSAQFLSNAARKLLFKHLSRLQNVYLTVQEPDGTQTRFGDSQASKQINISIYDKTAYGYITFGGSAGAGESYFLKLWDTDDLVGLVRAMMHQPQMLQNLEQGFTRWVQAGYRLTHRQHGNSVSGGRKNIEAHYDLGNDFFETFLDKRMLYSCAIYPNNKASLDEAQLEKIDRVCRKLNLQPEDHLLEIGTGWGAMAIHAAQAYGCKVTTTTISAEQYTYTAAEIKRLGLEDQITLLSMDYRKLSGQYDKLVSVEMIEAVGDKYLDSYFSQCAQLLKPDGLMLLQAITVKDQGYEGYLSRVDFIQRFVFPGGCLPSLTRISNALAGKTDMTLLHQEDLAPHYARTLAEWSRRLKSSQQQLLQAGYEERLLRLWDFYLSSCEAAFTERTTGLVQMLMMKPAARPMPYLPDFQTHAPAQGHTLLAMP
ncbi:MAG: cyclopropane-fatty-acyl-phospholipid synthase [Candidatus Azotimanducaceae bacterium]|jgi:cyclopropane-fatty-acyl-phospholipid synthase